jgi:hypothetical protein
MTTPWDSEKNREGVLKDFQQGRHSVGERAPGTGVGPSGDHSGLRDPVRRVGPGTLEQRVAAIEDRLNALEERNSQGA